MSHPGDNNRVYRAGFDERPKAITAHRFLQALTDAGVLGRDERVRRVVIDAEVDSAVVVHVERYGDERLLSVTRTLEGIEVRREEPASQ